MALVRHGIVYTSSFPTTYGLTAIASRMAGRAQSSFRYGKLRRLDARTLRPVQPAADFSKGACALDQKDELDEVRDWVRWSRTCCIRNAAARPMRLAAAEFSPMPNPAPIWITTGEAIAANFRSHEAAAPESRAIKCRWSYRCSFPVFTVKAAAAAPVLSLPGHPAGEVTSTLRFIPVIDLTFLDSIYSTAAGFPKPWVHGL